MRTTRGVAAIVAALALAGCGATTDSGAGDVPSDPTRATSSSDTTADPTGERCPYLTAERVTDVLGSPTTETSGTVHACFFDPTSGDGPSVLLSRVDVQIDPTDYATQSKALCKGEVITVDAGDEAFACVMGIGPQGQMYVDRVLITVLVDDAADDAAGIADAAALLAHVDVPPSTE